jgi:CRISPR-associated exonuclease Cas4
VSEPGDSAAEGAGEEDVYLIPLSALQHAVYCLRQAALIHIERLWAENRLTAEGRVVHLSTHEAGSRKMKGVRRVTSLPIACRALGLGGTADLVEFRPTGDGETPYPVEFKRGKPKRHRADEVQLCGQALCLEEMTGRKVPRGALFYGETKRRAEVIFDAELRALTLHTVAKLREIFGSGRTPPAVYKAGLCRACSLLELCRPKVIGREAGAWRDRRVAELLASHPQIL